MNINSILDGTAVLLFAVAEFGVYDAFVLPYLRVTF